MSDVELKNNDKKQIDSSLKMKIQLSVIEDLGIKLYSRLSSVISELVANAWDAEAAKVEINLPLDPISETSIITIEDFGEGMTLEELKYKYLVVGRKRRNEEKTDVTKKLHRAIMGRKGIGKLAGFGVADVVSISTVKDNLECKIIMNKNDIIEDAMKTGEYLPKIEYLNKTVDKQNGTIVTLSNIRRPKSIDSNQLRKDISKHFSVIDEKFSVSVNGSAITKADKLGKDNMEFKWEYNDESISEEHKEWKVSGWIGSTEGTLSEEDRGIVIMAHGKLLQSSTMFGLRTGNKYSYAYMTGLLNAEFMDADEDLIATDRQSLIWESPQGEALSKWGKDQVTKFADLRASQIKVKREKAIREDCTINSWLTMLTSPERKVADIVIESITSKETLDPERQKQLMYFVKDYFEYKSFSIMLSELKDTDNIDTILQIFEEWYVIEAREVLRIAQGRLKTLSHFKDLIDSNAREKPDLHDFLVKSPWIIDPSWTVAFNEKRFTTMLRSECKQKIVVDSNKQIDLVCIGTGDTIHVIEFKRPNVKITTDELNQVFEYVSFIKNQLGKNSPRSGRDYSSVAGYLICGRRPTDNVTRDLAMTFEGNRIHIYTYEDLIHNAETLMNDFSNKISEFEERDKTRKEIFGVGLAFDGKGAD